MNFASPAVGPQAGPFSRLRCALCGIDEFTEDAMTTRVGGRLGALCELCVTSVDRQPRLREGVTFAIGAGMCLADLARDQRRGSAAA